MTDDRDDRMLDITPTVNLLTSFRGARVSYPHLIGEGVDNAFDAGATRVEVEITEEHVIIIDNGCGIERDRIASIVSLGDHFQMSTTRLGRFGIGIKAQAINAGDRLAVNTVSKDGGNGLLNADWRKIRSSGKWKIPKPTWLPVNVLTPTGTRLEISSLRNPPSRSIIGPVIEQLAAWFYPAIAEGRTITVNRSEVPLLPEPQLTHVIERTLYLGKDGRSVAHLRGGLLGANSRLYQVQVSFGHRVMMANSPFGCGSYNGLRQMFARVVLEGQWFLAAFKDDLVDKLQRDELEDAIEEALLPILEKCDSTSMTADIAERIQLANDLLPRELAAARPHHTNTGPTSSGEKRKRKHGGLVKPEVSDPGGPARAPRPTRDQLIINLDGNAAEDGIGRFHAGRPNRVCLSKDDPYIAELLALKDKMFSARLLRKEGLFLYEAGREEPDQKDLFHIGLRIAKLLALQKSEPAAAETR
jgi:hypothetical protein